MQNGIRVCFTDWGVCLMMKSVVNLQQHCDTEFFCSSFSPILVCFILLILYLGPALLWTISRISNFAEVRTQSILIFVNKTFPSVTQSVEIDTLCSHHVVIILKLYFIVLVQFHTISLVTSTISIHVRATICTIRK